MFEINIRFQRHPIIFIVAILLIPWLILGSYKSYTYFATHIRTAVITPSPIIHQGSFGPWGRLVYADVIIGLPDEFVSIPTPSAPTNTWHFKNIDRAGVVSLLQSTGLPKSQIEALINNTPWSATKDGTIITPTDEQVLALTPEARYTIYSELLTNQGTSEGTEHVWFRPDMLDKIISKSGLQPASVSLLKRLLYSTPGSPLLIFTDYDVALRQLPNEAEQRLFVKALSSKATMMVRLQIDESSDVEELAKYWGRGGREKDVLPLMLAVQGLERGWDLSLLNLLPPMARNRLYTYPFPSPAAGAPKQDCFWTAFNLFSSDPDNRFENMDFVRQTLDKDYYSIYEPSQLGDIVFLATANGEVIHAAVHIADDVVFTKNGYHYTQPWILMHRKDMFATYAARYPRESSLHFLYFRKKEL